MVYEEIVLGLDINELRAYLDRLIKNRPHMPLPQYGGWGITTATGKAIDAWNYILLYKRKNLGSNVLVFNEEDARRRGLKKTKEDNIPTEFSDSYLKSVLTKIEQLGLNPRKARISVLKAGGILYPHQDGAEDAYCVRLHIPIVTNEKCLFIKEGEPAHMAANGNGYLVDVTKTHEVMNGGSEDRYHLMMDVWDTQKISEFHQFHGDFEAAKSW